MHAGNLNGDGQYLKTTSLGATSTLRLMNSHVSVPQDLSILSRSDFLCRFSRIGSDGHTLCASLEGSRHHCGVYEQGEELFSRGSTVLA